MLQFASPEIALETNLKIVKVTFVSVFFIIVIIIIKQKIQFPGKNKY